ncbi:hypothetical protein Nepgr_031516 [Nepenthes gracilis]|uniref:Uncharacterized protein n=1 Tax=Nepenthes gracilis TaxID=150966 RepID=A0AAD3TGV4_NEPGR|nr:hypothetical protein Nepgr_031516 [Nepenthes gracilis]
MASTEPEASYISPFLVSALPSSSLSCVRWIYFSAHIPLFLSFSAILRCSFSVTHTLSLSRAPREVRDLIAALRSLIGRSVLRISFQDLSISEENFVGYKAKSLGDLNDQFAGALHLMDCFMPSSDQNTLKSLFFIK